MLTKHLPWVCQNRKKGTPERFLSLSPQIDQDNADNFAREYDDSDLVYYEYEYEDDNIGNNNIGTGDLYDPNSLKDDMAYYYEYSHKLPVPSEKVQSKWKEYKDPNPNMTWT